jgi:hypothetical protein
VDLFTHVTASYARPMLEEKPSTPQVCPHGPNDVNSDISVRMERVLDIECLGRQWRILEARTAVTYFSSWGWVGNWLKLLPKEIAPYVLVAETAGHVVGLALFVEKSVTRHYGLFTSDVLFLQETGIPECDQLTLEYSNFLLDPAREQEIAACCIRYLATNLPEWDEIVMDWIERQSPPLNQNVLHELNLHLRINAALPSWYVDLQEIRRNNGEYLASISSNTRYQIRRSIRACEQYGQLTFQPAKSVTQALEFYEGLKFWHQKLWESRGLPGSFSSKFFDRFHQMLIQERFEHNEVQIVRVSAGQSVIGFIYNLLFNNRIYFYQSGFNYQLNSKIKPGYLCHSLAIDHNLKNGVDSYDFLASECRYKQSLSTKKNELIRVTIQRDRFKFRVEDLLRKIARYTGIRHSERRQERLTSDSDE